MRGWRSCTARRAASRGVVMEESSWLTATSRGPPRSKFGWDLRASGPAGNPGWCSYRTQSYTISVFESACAWMRPPTRRRAERERLAWTSPPTRRRAERERLAWTAPSARRRAERERGARVAHEVIEVGGRGGCHADIAQAQ